MSVYRRQRPPWRPERGQRVRLWPTRLSVSEPAGFVIVMAVLVALFVVALVAF